MQIRGRLGHFNSLKSMILWSFLLSINFMTVAGQAVGQTQLFSVIPKEHLDETPTQTQRLAQLRALPTTQNVQMIQIHRNALTGANISVSLPGQEVLSFTKRNELADDTHTLSWSGSAKNKLPTGMTIVDRDGQITGSISTPNGLYRLSPLGGDVHALIQVNSAKFPRDEPQTFRDKESSHSQISMPNKSDMHNNFNGSPTQIDVLIAYTPAAKAAVIDIDSTIALAVAEANQSYINSHIAIHLNLVDSFQVDYQETGKSFDKILADFKQIPDVNQHRDHSHADLSTLIISQSDYCGLADAIMADASTAFSIVHYDCATGYYSYAHELGHLMGARHNEQMDPGAPFAYGHGYLHVSPAPSWRTIMAYDCPNNCVRLQYWSNPQVNYGGFPMGTVAINDNARVLNESASTVAKFR